MPRVAKCRQKGARERELTVEAHILLIARHLVVWLCVVC
jgi:hypothetical protein